MCAIPACDVLVCFESPRPPSRPPTSLPPPCARFCHWIETPWHLDSLAYYIMSPPTDVLSPAFMSPVLSIGISRSGALSTMITRSRTIKGLSCFFSRARYALGGHGEWGGGGGGVASRPQLFRLQPVNNKEPYFENIYSLIQISEIWKLFWPNFNSNKGKHFIFIFLCLHFM